MKPKGPKSPSPLRPAAIKVACAIIESHGRILVAQRSRVMDRPFKWEFPGGKLHSGETLEAAIIREIWEELSLKITSVARLRPQLHRYPDKTIHLFPLLCCNPRGKMALSEHNTVLWILPGDMNKLDWCDADRLVAEDYLRRKESEITLSTMRVKHHTTSVLKPANTRASRKAPTRKRPSR